MSAPTPARPTEVRLRIVALGDPHLEEKTFERYLPIWDQMIVQVDRAKPDAIIIAGDLAGGRDTNHVWTLRERGELSVRLRLLSNIATVYIARGNHDNPRELAWLPSLAGRNPIIVSQDPELHRLRGIDAYLYLMPYPNKGALLQGATLPTIEEELAAMNEAVAARLRKFGSFVSSLKERAPHAPVIVATHLTWHGALPGGGEIFQPGSDVVVEPTLLEGIGADLVIGNHIHQPAQHWDRGFLNGSFYHGGFGEGGDDRFWWIHDFGGPATAEASSTAPATATQLSLTTYRYPTGAPKAITIYMRWDGEHLEGPEDLRVEELVGAHIRVIIEADEAHEATIPWGGLDHTFLDPASGDPLDWRPEVRIQRQPREVRAPRLIHARTDLEKLLEWAQVVGQHVDDEQRKRLHDRIEDPTRDVVGALAEAHPRFRDMIINATRRDSR